MPALRPILLLEVNEVHWRILDRALESPARSHLRRFVDSALTRTTHSGDVGWLSPWITWPSLHRGISNVEHGIEHLGQDVATFKGRAIWEEYRALGESIGICGSLQSWPPIDPGRGGFYVPDTFARDERCVPRYLEPLQRLNLDLVSESGRVGSRRVPLRAATRALPAAIRAKISPRFVARVMQQLLRERRDPTCAMRRPTFQTLFFWEIFQGLFDPRRPPAFSTFFTNHVAGLMHRHWDEVFPEDFPERAPVTKPLHTEGVAFAFDVLDELIGDALRFQEECPSLILVLASSMGQAAFRRTWQHGRELVLHDLARLLTRLGIPSSAYSVAPAMVPQAAANVPDAHWRDVIARELRGVRSSSGLEVFDVDARGASLSITLSTPSSEALDEGALTLADGSRATWEEAGMAVHVIPTGTGNHIAEGSLAIVGRGITPDAARASMRATDVKALLLELAGV
jgi:hypothetical protein